MLASASLFEGLHGNHHPSSRRAMLVTQPPLVITTISILVRTYSNFKLKQALSSSVLFFAPSFSNASRPFEEKKADDGRTCSTVHMSIPIPLNQAARTSPMPRNPKSARVLLIAFIISPLQSANNLQKPASLSAVRISDRPTLQSTSHTPTPVANSNLQAPQGPAHINQVQQTRTSAWFCLLLAYR